MFCFLAFGWAWHGKRIPSQFIIFHQWRRRISSPYPRRSTAALDTLSHRYATQYSAVVSPNYERGVGFSMRPQREPRDPPSCIAFDSSRPSRPLFNVYIFSYTTTCVKPPSLLGHKSAMFLLLELVHNKSTQLPFISGLVAHTQPTNNH